MKNQHPLAPGVSAFTFHAEPDNKLGLAPGWYGYRGIDENPADETDDLGPFPTEAECLAALREEYETSTTIAADIASAVVDAKGRPVDFPAAVRLMDDDLREELHRELAPCSDQQFLEEYARRHQERFGEEFPPYAFGAW